MTVQDVIDEVNGYEIFPSKEKAKELLTIVFSEVRPSYGGGRCVYNTSMNGVGCAAGALVPEKMKNLLVENKTIAACMEFSPELKKFFQNLQFEDCEDCNYICTFQRLHDMYAVAINRNVFSDDNTEKMKFLNALAGV